MMNPEDEQCPVCGYYCLGNGGYGCIDKPSLVKNKSADRIEELESVLRLAKDALVMNIVGTGGRTPASHEAIAKINKVLK